MFPSFIAYLFFNRGIELIGAARAGQSWHLMPVFGSILAVLFLGETFYVYHAVGIALIAAGIVLASQRAATGASVISVRGAAAPSRSTRTTSAPQVAARRDACAGVVSRKSIDAACASAPQPSSNSTRRTSILRYHVSSSASLVGANFHMTQVGRPVRRSKSRNCISTVGIDQHDGTGARRAHHRRLEQPLAAIQHLMCANLVHQPIAL